MIRLTYLLRRKPGMSLDEFQTHWRTVHGPLVASHAFDLDCLRHVQCHAIEIEDRPESSGARGVMEPPYDGVIEMWWDDIETLERALATNEGKQAAAELLEAERDFIDLPASPLWFNYEYPQINPTPENFVARERSTIVKLYYPIRAPQTLSLDEAQLYWRTNHGPLVRRHAAGAGLLRYIQVHRFPHGLETAWREARGTEVEPYMGHAETWNDRATAARTPEGKVSRNRAFEDERNFIDFSRSVAWMNKEYVFVDRM